MRSIRVSTDSLPATPSALTTYFTLWRMMWNEHDPTGWPGFNTEIMKDYDEIDTSSQPTLYRRHQVF